MLRAGGISADVVVAGLDAPPPPRACDDPVSRTNLGTVERSPMQSRWLWCERDRECNVQASSESVQFSAVSSSGQLHEDCNGTTADDSLCN